jgi:outer membrane protein OmpA-like peptidoglycan-associated protein
MNAQRRDAERRTAESVERVWQLYADEIGIPKVGESERGGDSLPRTDQEGPHAPQPVRSALPSVGRPLVAVGLVGVLIVGVALWRGSPGVPKSAALRSPIAAVPRETVQPAQRAPDAVSPSGPRPGATTTAGKGVMHRITFDFGSDRIPDESKPTLDRMAAAMKTNRDWRVAIEGHTDTQGTAEYNRALSERRALAVKAYLQSAGIAPERLSVAGFGASRPVASNDTRGEGLNRRVDLYRR